MPSVNATATETKQGVPAAFSRFTPRKQFRANLALAAYEIDFFGRLRNLKKSALENFLASEQARNITKIAIITEVANSYSQLLLDREILKILEENLSVQNQKYELLKLRYENGIDSKSDLLNSQIMLENAKANCETYKKLVQQDQNALMILVGKFDDKILPQESTIDQIKIDESLLDFIPSKSLLTRPDIKQAEHQLKSANANIGAARAAFFPSITLTGTYGYGSSDLNSLFDSRSWTFSPQINLPIFNGGKNTANLNLANLTKKIEIIEYEKVIQTAFRETLDQLAERKSAVNQLKSFEDIFNFRKKNYEISELKNHEGIISKIDLFDTKIAFLTAQQNRLSAKKEYLSNLITLYKVLGGGSEIIEIESKK